MDDIDARMSVSFDSVLKVIAYVRGVYTGWEWDYHMGATVPRVVAGARVYDNGVDVSDEIAELVADPTINIC